MEVVGFIVLAVLLFGFASLVGGVWQKFKNKESLIAGDYLILGMSAFMIVVLFQALGLVVIVVGLVAWFISSKISKDSDELEPPK